MEKFCQLTRTYVWVLPVTVKLTSCSSCLSFSWCSIFCFRFAKHREKTCFLFHFFNQMCCEWRKCFKIFKDYKSVSKVDLNAVVCYSNVFLQYVINSKLQLLLTKKINKKVTKNWYRTWILLTLTQLLWEAITTISRFGRLSKAKSSAASKKFNFYDSFSVKTVCKNGKTVGHLPRELSRVTIFLGWRGFDAYKVIFTLL